MAESAKVRIGDRVVRVTSSEVPEGIEGTVLSYMTAPGYEGRWEVEYEACPCPRRVRMPGDHSPTSWASRETSIELTRDEVRRREAEKESMA